MEDKPSDEQLQQLFQVIRAWNRVNKRKARRKNTVAKEPYTRWVLDRVQIVKLPFDIDLEYKPEVLEVPLMSLEEIGNLKNALKQAHREKEELELNLHNLTKEKRQMQCILE